eukprot:CAMPEP_0176344804 /NCGR_PEP_ID=MMETSP0126-20121128/4968_1 /TAXON_ID=141414 ORGANISM="Strombidinopsis acuminatum, Strain SPMC142" /NCGR_SAMPLE_ID=MMETSP0126 /ASSEMBLY_ACC=CAM_ASM_000229 /LENGTH=80 /DNA_ID=CAMNT_0017691435 /DNA_START=1066 /DNA_END=1308 /DNA_ORIENTATION=+
MEAQVKVEEKKMHGSDASLFADVLGFGGVKKTKSKGTNNQLPEVKKSAMSSTTKFLADSGISPITTEKEPKKIEINSKLK